MESWAFPWAFRFHTDFAFGVLNDFLAYDEAHSKPILITDFFWPFNFTEHFAKFSYIISCQAFAFIRDLHAQSLLVIVILGCDVDRFAAWELDGIFCKIHKNLL